MHSRGVAHRDIKIENLMFLSRDDDTVKIGDFGLARLLTNGVAVTPCGTKEYMAPEMFERSPEYTMAVDVWALGCLIFIVLFGRFPFYNDEDDRNGNMMSIKDKIRHGRYSFPKGNEAGATVSEEAKDLITKCLQVDARLRYTINQVLSHSWLRNKQDLNLPLASPAFLRDNKDMINLRDISKVGAELIRGSADAAMEQSGSGSAAQSGAQANTTGLAGSNDVAAAVLAHQRTQQFKLSAMPLKTMLQRRVVGAKAAAAGTAGAATVPKSVPPQHQAAMTAAAAAAAGLPPLPPMAGQHPPSQRTKRKAESPGDLSPDGVEREESGGERGTASNSSGAGQADDDDAMIVDSVTDAAGSAGEEEPMAIVPQAAVAGSQ